MSELESPTLNPEQTAHMLQWLEALESGRYPQGFNALIQFDVGDSDNRVIVGYCCLAVAIDVAVEHGCTVHWDKNQGMVSYGAAPGRDPIMESVDFSHDVLVQPVTLWYGFDQDSPTIDVPCHVLGSRDQDSCGLWGYPGHSLAGCDSPARVEATALNDKYQWPLPRIAAAFRNYYNLPPATAQMGDTQ